MPTPEDFARLDVRIQKFWAKHGVLVDWILIVIAAVVIAWTAGYLTGRFAP